MPKNRNRITYNIQDVFFGYAQDEKREPVVPGYQILKRINRIQGFNYDIATDREAVSVVGRRQTIARPSIKPPEVSIDFSYILEGVNNERRMGLSVHGGESFTDHTLPIHLPFISGYVDENRGLDKRNVYLCIAQEEEEIHGQHDGYINYPLVEGNIGDIIDPQSTGYGVLAFQNCYLKSYDVDISLGRLPEANVSMVADNAVYYSSGSGLNVPYLDPKDGQVKYESEKIIVPKHFKEDDPNLNGVTLLTFKPGDITVDIQKETEEGLLFHTDTVQGCSVRLNLERSKISYAGNKLYSDRPIVVPSIASMSLDFLVKENLDGDFLNDLDRDEDYRVKVSFKKDNGEEGMGYTFAYAKFDDIKYNSNISQQKTAKLTLSADIDLDNIRRGIFISGQMIAVTQQLYEEGNSTPDGSEKDIYEVIDGEDTDIGGVTFPLY